MAHVVNLTKNHRRLLLEALLESLSIKEARLKNPASIDAMVANYNDAAVKLSKPVECGRLGHKSGDNLFGWLIDQFYHSGDLTKTEFGKMAVNICQAAGDGEYESFCRMTIMNTLFE